MNFSIALFLAFALPTFGFVAYEIIVAIVAFKEKKWQRRRKEALEKARKTKKEERRYSQCTKDYWLNQIHAQETHVELLLKEKFFTGHYIFSSGKLCFYKNGKLHRENGMPAVFKFDRKQTSLSPPDLINLYYGNGNARLQEKFLIEEIMCGSDENEYWINGERVTRESAKVFALLFPKEKEKECQPAEKVVKE